MNVYRHEAGHACVACALGMHIVDICNWHVAIDYDPQTHSLKDFAMVVMAGIVAGENREDDVAYHRQLAQEAMGRQIGCHGLDFAEADMDRLAWIGKQDAEALDMAATQLHKVFDKLLLGQIAEEIEGFHVPYAGLDELRKSPAALENARKVRVIQQQKYA